MNKQHTVTTSELEKYKLLVESIQDYAIFLLDKDGYIQTWNKGAERNKGYRTDEIIGKHFSIFYEEADKKARKPEKELEIAERFGRAEDEDWRVRKDGSQFWASVIITALHDKNNKIIGFAKVTRDLSERKQHEDDLRKANTLLRSQQRELEMLNLAKDEFISLASHQLRTPATAIKQLLGLFVEGFEKDIGESSLEIIKRAYDSNERQINIVNSLLKVAQVDSGKVVLKMSEFNVYELLESIINDFRNALQAKNQTVKLKVDDPKITLLADSQNIRMALENLISNASKYTYPYGTIKLEVSQSKNNIKISIEDNGIGIAKQDIGLLFEKFRRIPNDLSEDVDGTGLGLYWAHKVITLHEGRIDVKSEINEGTKFTVHLPLRQTYA